MRLYWMLPVALLGCSNLGTPRPAPAGVPDDLRDAPAARIFPESAGEALYLRLVSQTPEQAAESVMALSSDDSEALERHVLERKVRDNLLTARFEVDTALPPHESAFICWYLGGFTHTATLGRPRPRRW